MPRKAAKSKSRKRRGSAILDSTNKQQKSTPPEGAYGQHVNPKEGCFLMNVGLGPDEILRFTLTDPQGNPRQRNNRLRYECSDASSRGPFEYPAYEASSMLGPGDDVACCFTLECSNKLPQGDLCNFPWHFHADIEPEGLAILTNLGISLEVERDGHTHDSMQIALWDQGVIYRQRGLTIDRFSLDKEATQSVACQFFCLDGVFGVRSTAEVPTVWFVSNDLEKQARLFRLVAADFREEKDSPGIEDDEEEDGDGKIRKKATLVLHGEVVNNIFPLHSGHLGLWTYAKNEGRKQKLWILNAETLERTEVTTALVDWLVQWLPTQPGARSLTCVTEVSGRGSFLCVACMTTSVESDDKSDYSDYVARIPLEVLWKA